jgi:hypothetical protein
MFAPRRPFSWSRRNSRSAVTRERCPRQNRQARPREHHGEAVAAFAEQPLLHLVRHRFRRAHHGEAGIAAEPLRELPHGQILTPGEPDVRWPLFEALLSGIWSGSGPSGSDFDAWWPSAIGRRYQSRWMRLEKWHSQRNREVLRYSHQPALL